MTKKTMRQVVFWLGACFLATTWAGEYLNCMLVNQVGDGGELKTLTDRQVENGLCIITKQTVQAIGDKNMPIREICIKASMYMTREFIKRFPGRNPSEMVGKC